MERARTTGVDFDNGLIHRPTGARLIRERRGETEANLAINAGRQNCIREWRGRTAHAEIGEQINLKRIRLRWGGERQPARRVIPGEGARMRVHSGKSDKEMGNVRADGTGRGCGSRHGADFEMDEPIGCR